SLRAKALASPGPCLGASFKNVTAAAGPSAALNSRYIHASSVLLPVPPGPGNKSRTEPCMRARALTSPARCRSGAFRRAIAAAVPSAALNSRYIHVGSVLLQAPGRRVQLSHRYERQRWLLLLPAVRLRSSM